MLVSIGAVKMLKRLPMFLKFLGKNQKYLNFFQADFKLLRGPDQKSLRATYGPRAGGCPYMI